jgi:hypothetical protein
VTLGVTTRGPLASSSNLGEPIRESQLIAGKGNYLKKILIRASGGGRVAGLKSGLQYEGSSV